MKRRLIFAGVALLPHLPAALVAQDLWATDVTGTWITDANWVDGTAPTAADSVVINVIGNPYAVQLFANADIASLLVSSNNATLQTSTAGPAFTLNVSGTATINAGTVSNSNTYHYNTASGITINGGTFQLAGHAATTVSNGILNNAGGQLRVRGIRNSLGTATFGANLTVNGGLTNLGSLTLETNRGANGGTFAILNVPGTLNNSGTIDSKLFEGAGSGGRSINTGSLINSGTIINNDVNGLKFFLTDATYQNGNTLNAANGKFDFRNIESFDNLAAGQLIGSEFSIEGNNSATSEFENAGTINISGNLAVKEVETVINSGTITTSTGAVDLRTKGGTTSSIENTSTGVININNGGIFDSAEDIDNAGDINVNSGQLIVEMGLGGSNANQFNHTGDLEIAPGASLNMRQQFFGGEGAAIFNLEPGATLDGGGDIFFTRIVGNINTAWSPDTSFLSLNLGSLSGTGPLNISGSANLISTTLNLPVINTGTVDLKTNGTVNIYGPFTNEPGAMLPIDAPAAGGITVKLNNNDLTNRGLLEMKGVQQVLFNHQSTVTSTGKLINEPSGTINISGTGTRRIDVPFDNQGALNIDRITQSLRSAATYSNSGTLTASENWAVTSALSIENSGNLTSTGGNFDFRFNQDPASHFTNTASGIVTIENGATIDNVEDVNNAGDILLNNGTLLIELGLGGSNANQFTNSGDLQLAPGTTFSLRQQFIGGDGQAIFNLEPGGTLGGGGNIVFTRVQGSINTPWAPGASPLTLSLSNISGTGPISLSDSLILSASSLTAPTSSSGTATVQAGSGNTVLGDFTNEATGTFNVDSAIGGSVDLKIHNSDFVNRGQFNVLGNTTSGVNPLSTSTSTKGFINESTGTVTISGTGTRDWDVPLTNSGQFNVNSPLRSNRNGIAYENSGTVALASNWDIDGARSFANSGLLTSTGGLFDFLFDQNAASHFTNAATGTWNIENGAIVDNFEIFNSEGDINVNNGTLTVQLGLGGGNATQFNHTGDIEIAPGATFVLNKQSNSGAAIFNLESGSTFDGGGDIFFTSITGTFNAPWAPGDSPLDVNACAITGVGPLNISSAFKSRASTISVPVNNSGTATFQAGNSDLHGIFTNETTGTVNVNSALAGAFSLRLHTNDFINRGEFNLTGNTTVGVNPVNTNTSTAAFINESTGTVSITGTGIRDWDVHLDNRGQFNIDVPVRSNRNNITYANSGTLTLAANWDVDGARSITNSGLMTSTGGFFDFLFDQNAASHFTNTGTWNIENGGVVDNFENFNSDGTINVNNGTLTVQLGLGGGNATQFNHTGDIEVAPGAAFVLNKQGNSGLAVFNFEPGATLDGGGDITFTSTTVNLNGPFTPGTSTFDTISCALNGPGPLNITGDYFNRSTALFLPVNNSGTTTFQRSGTTADVRGAFTNELGGTVNVNSALSGAITIAIHDEDFTNNGQLNFTGNTTTDFSYLNTNTSTAALVNEDSGTITIDGTGTRRIRTSITNRGLIECQSNTTLGLSARNISNSGELQVSAGVTTTMQFGANFTNEPGGVLSGAGSLALTGVNFTNNGTVSPGMSVGTLSAAGTFTSGPTAVLDVEITSNAGPGTGHDFLSVSGSLVMDGTITPKVIGFLPALNDQFVVAQCTGTLSGTAQVSPDSGFTVTVDAGLKQVILTAVSPAKIAFAQFQSQFFTPQQITAGDADAGNDFDFDGLNNFLEWIYGEDPTSIQRLTPDATMQENASGNLVFTYPQSTLLPLIDIAFQTNPDLQVAWTDIDPADYSRTEAPLIGVPDVNLVSLEITDPALTAAARGFFRVEFSAP